MWHPAAAPLAALHGEGKLTVLPAVGYDHPGPVALHVAPLLGGRRARPAACAPAGWAATSIASARPTTRCRASRWAARSGPRWRPARTGRRGRHGRGLSASGRPACGATSRTGHARRDRRHRRRSTCARDPALAAGGAGGRVHRRSCAGARAAARKAASRRTRRRRLPEVGRRLPASGSRASPAMLAAGLPLRCVAITRAGRLRHARRPGSERCGRTSTLRRRRAARVPARPRGARPRRPRAHRSCGRSSGAGRRRTARAAPTTAPPGSAFLIGSRVAGG